MPSAQGNSNFGKQPTEDIFLNSEQEAEISQLTRSKATEAERTGRTECMNNSKFIQTCQTAIDASTCAVVLTSTACFMRQRQNSG